MKIENPNPNLSLQKYKGRKVSEEELNFFFKKKKFQRDEVVPSKNLNFERTLIEGKNRPLLTFEKCSFVKSR